MRPIEKINNFMKQIQELQKQERQYKKELIASIIQESTKGNKLVMVRPDGKKFLIQRNANTRGGRNVYDEAGNIIHVDVRYTIDDVKYIIALI
jgi:hypothetical protein